MGTPEKLVEKPAQNRSGICGSPVSSPECGTRSHHGTKEDTVEEEDKDGANDETEDRESGSGIADDVVPEVELVVELPPLFRTGSWNISFTETGEANCGYPEIPLTFDATLVIGLLDADGPDGADDDGDDGDDQAYEYEIRIERPFGQVFFGVGSGLPVQVEASGSGWSEVTTITDLDFDNGVFLATSYYSTDECGAERILVGGGF